MTRKKGKRDPLHMGHKLRRLLAERNISQVELAKGLGITRQGICFYSQTPMWQSKTIYKVATYLQVPTQYFFEP